MQLSYSLKNDKLAELAYVAEFNNTDTDHVYKLKINHKSGVSALWKFKTGILGNNTTQSFGLFTSSIVNQDPLLYGFQTEINM